MQLDVHSTCVVRSHRICVPSPAICKQRGGRRPSRQTLKQLRRNAFYSDVKRKSPRHAHRLVAEVRLTACDGRGPAVTELTSAVYYRQLL